MKEIIFYLLFFSGIGILLGSNVVFLGKLLFLLVFFVEIIILIDGIDFVFVFG